MYMYQSPAVVCPTSQMMLFINIVCRVIDFMPEAIHIFLFQFFLVFMKRVYFPDAYRHGRIGITATKCIDGWLQGHCQQSSTYTRFMNGFFSLLDLECCNLFLDFIPFTKRLATVAMKFSIVLSFTCKVDWELNMVYTKCCDLIYGNWRVIK